MAGNPEQGKKSAQTSKDLYGKDFHSKIGAIGGAAKVKKGLATLSPEQRKKIATMGGKKSKPGKKKK